MKKNLDILTAQITELHKEEEVEINICDNASTDETKLVCEQCISSNPHLHISYHCNGKNIGPDGNFIKVMHLASGEYSLLWGDDDYLKDGGLARIFELADHGDKCNVQIMLSSTSVYDKEGAYQFEKFFLREDIEELTTDFSNQNQWRGYFFLLKDMGGLLSFISSVVYKTSIIKEIPFDNSFIGTHYAFLCYWWGWLAKGKKLYYSKQSFLMETYQYQFAYGFGINRLMVDYNGYLLIVDKLLNTDLKKDFLLSFKNLHKLYSLIETIHSDRSFRTKLLPALYRTGYTEVEIRTLYSFCSFKNQLKRLLYRIVPSKLIFILITLKKKI